MATQILVAVAFAAMIAIAALLVAGGIGGAVADRRRGRGPEADAAEGDPRSGDDR